MTVVVLAALFLYPAQRDVLDRGIFGPVMLLWFGVIGLLGLGGIARNPVILEALNPVAAVSLPVGMRARLFRGHRQRLSRGDRWRGLLRRYGTLRAVADSGRVVRHRASGADPQLFKGGLLLSSIRDRSAARWPTSLQPSWAHYPLVLLATAATVIASQAVISGRPFDDALYNQPRSPATNEHRAHSRPVG